VGGGYLLVFDFLVGAAAAPAAPRPGEAARLLHIRFAVRHIRALPVNREAKAGMWVLNRERRPVRRSPRHIPDMGSAMIPV